MNEKNSMKSIGSNNQQEIADLKVMMSAQTSRLNELERKLTSILDGIISKKRQDSKCSDSQPDGKSSGGSDDDSVGIGTGEKKKGKKGKGKNRGTKVKKEEKDTAMTRHNAIMAPLVPYREEVFSNDKYQVRLLRCTLLEFLDTMEKSGNELTPAGLIHVFDTPMFRTERISRKASETKDHNKLGASPRGSEVFLKMTGLCLS